MVYDLHAGDFSFTTCVHSEQFKQIDSRQSSTGCLDCELLVHAVGLAAEFL